MKNLKVPAVVSAAALLLTLTVLAQGHTANEMPPERIRQAIDYGTKEKNVELYEIKVGGGFVWDKEKVRWGYYSTPFLRIALAANRAKKQYKSFSEKDVTQEMTAPELHVYAGAVAQEKMAVANVEAVVITRAKEKDRSKAIQPTLTIEMPEEFQNLFGAKTSGRSVKAVFPLDLLSDQYEIHIVYDRRVVSGVTGCDDCSMRLKPEESR
jgi:hypothetical protein